MKKHTFLIVIILCSFILEAQENSQWRGPNRDGKFPDKDLLNVWPENGPELVWKYDQLGLGFSGPAFTSDGFYITGTTDSIGSIFFFDLKGELQWKKEYGGEWMTNFPGSRSTPTIVGDLGYVLSGLGLVYCFDANNGDNVWTVDLFKEYGGKKIMFGITEVLLVKGDILYCTAGGEEHNILALNRLTGDLKWSSKGAQKASAYTPPILFTHNGIEYLATFNALTALAINAENGKLAWTYPMIYDGGIHGNSPIYRDGQIFIMDGWKAGSRSLKIADDGQSVELAWENDLMDLENGGAILIGDNLYAANWKEKGISCVNWNTGEEKFSTKELISGTLSYADGMFYYYGINGKLALVKANETSFEVLSSFQLEGKKSRDHSAHLVIQDQKLYVRFNETLWAFDIAN